jgi:alpha-N-arabinofuranosidase
MKVRSSALLSFYKKNDVFMKMNGYLKVLLPGWILFFALLGTLFSQTQSFRNPILPGAYPDPSICRVGEDFYLVNSSFEYFPGLPIHHSKDLVNWELIGYGLHRPEQASGAVNLVDVQQDGGIHAPTLRYHEGTFYLITTNVYSPADPGKPTEMVNFILTARHPAGPWSDPHVIEGAPGIDPDLFFDDDGKTYFVGTHDVGKPETNGIGEIWIQELDLVNWKLVGTRHSVWRGACGGCCVEGPHLYKEHGKYYLLIAEGGTSHYHAVMMAASENIYGPYESNPRNPILTSRHLSKNNWVTSTGHADMVELQDGRWYMVALSTRNELQGHSNMGRETHLVPLTWEPATLRWEEVRPGVWEPLDYLWPVAAPETGKVERYTALPFADRPQYKKDAFLDNFNSGSLNLEWNFRRVPANTMYSLTAKPNYLRILLQPETISMRGRSSLMGIRQKESDFEYTAELNFSPRQDGEEAGISHFQKDDNYINFTVSREEGKNILQLVVKEREKASELVAKKPLEDYRGNIRLQLISKGDRYTYQYSLDGGQTFTVFTQIPARYLLSNGYTGAYLGLYASSNGQPTDGYADIDWVFYQDFQR